MDMMQWLYIAVAAIAGMGGAALAARSHYGRQLSEQRHRIDKLEKARQVASQHYAQAQAQIELLQKELLAAHKAVTEAARAHDRGDAQVDSLARRRQALSDALDAAARTLADDEAPRDFADTQPA
jgi:septal ring factor EnvC (AmiA/AmiB activator)